MTSLAPLLLALAAVGGAWMGVPAVDARTVERPAFAAAREASSPGRGPVPVAQAVDPLSGADTLPGRRVSVVYWDGLDARARELQAGLEGAPALLGLPEGVPSGVTLWLADTEERFQALVGGAAPDWSAAVALLDRDAILLPVYASNRTRFGDRVATLRHEWAHIGLAQWLADLRVPRWFHEGYARVAAGEWDARSGWALRWALARGTAPLLDSLTLDWPDGGARARLAYDLSASAVEYLLSQPAGEEGLRIFLERWRLEGSFDDALGSVFGFTPGRFETAWVRWLKRRYGWLLLLSQSVALWLALGVTLLVLWRWRRRRMTRRMARLRADEPPDEPAWWEEPPSPSAPSTPPDPGRPAGPGAPAPADPPGAPRPPVPPSNPSEERG